MKSVEYDKIKFFFEWRGHIVQLPLNPETITITSEGANETKEVISIGQINILRDKKLSNINFDCFLPNENNAPYIVTSVKFKPPEFYLRFFDAVRKSLKPARFIVTGTRINMLVSIENFTWKLEAGDSDTHYTIALKEFKPFGAKSVEILDDDFADDYVEDERPKQGFSIGDTVIVNGPYWHTSYGTPPFGVFKNFRGKLSHIVADKNRAFRFHITTLTGGWRGWVKESQMEHI